MGRRLDDVELLELIERVEGIHCHGRAPELSVVFFKKVLMTLLELKVHRKLARLLSTVCSTKPANSSDMELAMYGEFESFSKNMYPEATKDEIREEWKKHDDNM